MESADIAECRNILSAVLVNFAAQTLLADEILNIHILLNNTPSIFWAPTFALYIWRVEMISDLRI